MHLGENNQIIGQVLGRPWPIRGGVYQCDVTRSTDCYVVVPRSTPPRSPSVRNPQVGIPRPIKIKLVRSPSAKKTDKIWLNSEGKSRWIQFPSAKISISPWLMRVIPQLVFILSDWRHVWIIISFVLNEILTVSMNENVHFSYRTGECLIKTPRRLFEEEFEEVSQTQFVSIFFGDEPRGTRRFDRRDLGGELKKS